MSKTLSVLVEDEPRALMRISGLFSRRGFNIKSIVVGKSEFENLSRMTIVVNDDQQTELVVKQLNKLINVIKVSEFDESQLVQRELCMFKVKVSSDTRREVQEICDNFRAKVVDVSLNSMVVEVTGTEDKIEALENILQHFGILETVRTGVIGVTRGMQASNYSNKQGEMYHGKNVL